MKSIIKNFSSLLFIIIALYSCHRNMQTWSVSKSWSFLQTKNTCSKRHECGAVSIHNKLYLIGGRGIKPVEVLDVSANKWELMVPTPIEMHHFQAIEYNGEIIVAGAFTGPYPHEIPIPHFWIYNPQKNEWRKGADIPEDRRRGAAGVFKFNNKIYLVNGIIDGHWAGHVAWFDEYNPMTNQWKVLPDSPHARDHFQAAIIDKKLIVAGGRKSSSKTKEIFELTVGEVDVFDFENGKWSTLPSENNLPTHRAGSTTVVMNNNVIVIGGESGSQVEAHKECEALDIKTMKWQNLKLLNTGRHGTQAVIIKNKIYLASGCANRGGSPEQNSVEVY
jgi:hypothetical protein